MSLNKNAFYEYMYKRIFEKGVIMNSNQFEAFILDLDGTLYVEDQILPGAEGTVKCLRNTGASLRFITNNPRYSKQFYVDKLNRLGIDAKSEEVITSANLAATYLASNPQYDKVYVLGEKQLKKELSKKGVSLIEEASANTVLVSFDTTVTYEKLQRAHEALRNGAHFIATNPDILCPTLNGGMIDAGALIALLEASSGRKLLKVIGKPSKLMAELVLKQLEIPAERCVVVGDRLYTDVQLGNRAGMTTVWINRERERIPNNFPYQPDYEINEICELLYALGLVEF